MSLMVDIVKYVLLTIVAVVVGFKVYVFIKDMIKKIKNRRRVR